MPAPAPAPDTARPDQTAADQGPIISEEDASQGFKTGHIRWVLAISFVLVVAALGLTAFFKL